MSISKTYAEQVEDLRPDFGFTILSDGTVVRGRNPDSYDEELVQYWQKRWTSQKHGAIYDLEDLMAVQMVNDDLKGFVSRWDAVIAGMREDPGTRWKEAYFHSAVKRFKPLEHDLAIYDRAPEG